MWRIGAFFVCPLLFLVSGGAFAAAGYIHDMKGKPTVSVQNGPAVELKVGALVDRGQTIRTPAGGGATVKFADGQVMVLRENTAFRIDDYAYDSNKIKESRGIFSLITGGLRAISGIIGSSNRQAFKLTAGTATIGIRGTDIDISILAGQITAAVSAGALTMVTPEGTSAIGIGQYSTVTGNVVTPAASIALAPAAVRAAITSSLTQANIPVNTPVVVAASATAAAAAAASNLAAAQQKVAAAVAAATADALLKATSDAARASAKIAADNAAAALVAANTAATNAATTASQTLLVAINAATVAYANAQANGATPVAPPAAAPPQPGAAAAAAAALAKAEAEAEAVALAIAKLAATAAGPDAAAAAAAAALAVQAAADAAQAAAAAAAIVAPVRCDPVLQALQGLASCS